MMETIKQALFDLRTHDPKLIPPNETERAASYPPAYPDGWYKIGDARDLPRGGIKHVAALGERWVLFRSDISDELTVLDATCPHQGANLASGTVKAGCLECPFHRWQFASDGKVAQIPYATGFPPSLRARSWPVREYHGLIVVWYSASASATRARTIEPAYELQPLESLGPHMVYRGAHDHPRPVRMHLIEFAENSVDFQHFGPLHGRMHVPWTRWRVPFVTVNHTPEWTIDEHLPHVAYFYDDAVLAFAGRRLPSSKARASITFLGPGGVTVFRISIPELGDVVLFHTHTPTAALEQTVHFRWYADQRMPRLLVSYIVGSWIAQWRNDIAIWENKFFAKRPMLVPGDGPVLRMRRWYKQFYPTPVELEPAQESSARV